MTIVLFATTTHIYAAWALGFSAAACWMCVRWVKRQVDGGRM